MQPVHLGGSRRRQHGTTMAITLTTNTNGANMHRRRRGSMTGTLRIDANQTLAATVT